MNHYCTYFDRGYLAQGLAMWGSLVRHDPAAVLWVLALDGETAAVLRAQPETGLRVLELAELVAVDPDLAAVQAVRPRSEFIFTLTPCLVRHLLRTHPAMGSLAYVDADLFFFSDPAPCWRALAAGSVLVVAHRYPPWHDDGEKYGHYNVGLLIFRDDENGRACVEWWRSRCLESCALSGDGTHYGDQKYLDEWPRRFAGVVECRHPGVNVAPWNWARHHFSLLPDGGVRVDGEPLVVFHFAQFRRVRGQWYDSGQLEYGIMPLRLRSRIYGAYAAALPAAFPLPARGWRAALGAWHLAALRLAWGQFWWRCGPWWLAGRCGLGQFSGRAMAIYRRFQRGRP
ncbi:MAG: hypothetical protein JSR48_13000 [Verrucomicrobia bacterium]|nr:hypothetical protein [Verrucomicrobiota bacterium]